MLFCVHLRVSRTRFRITWLFRLARSCAPPRLTQPHATTTTAMPDGVTVPDNYKPSHPAERRVLIDMAGVPKMIHPAWAEQMKKKLRAVQGLALPHLA